MTPDILSQVITRLRDTQSAIAKTQQSLDSAQLAGVMEELDWSIARLEALAEVISPAPELEESTGSQRLDRYLASVHELERVVKGFQSEALNGVICSPPSNEWPNWDAAPNRTWCARCKSLWKRLFAVARMLQGEIHEDERSTSERFDISGADSSRGTGPKGPTSMVNTTPPAPAPKEGWQPIETAPKEERVLAVLKPRPFETVGEITFVYWVQGVWTRDETGESEVPTHWMPLPPAPSTDEPPSVDAVDPVLATSHEPSTREKDL